MYIFLYVYVCVYIYIYIYIPLFRVCFLMSTSWQMLNLATNSQVCMTPCAKNMPSDETPWCSYGLEGTNGVPRNGGRK